MGPGCRPEDGALGGGSPHAEFERGSEFVLPAPCRGIPLQRRTAGLQSGPGYCGSDYEAHFAEEQVSYSNTLCTRGAQGHGLYFVGPLARYHLNFDRLSPLAQEAAQEAGLSRECRNPFQSIIVRAVETLYAVAQALRIITRPTNGLINRPLKSSPAPG